MYESGPGRPGSGLLSGSGGQPDKPDRWLSDGWFRPQPGEEDGPASRRNWPLIRRHWALIAGMVFFLFDTFLMVDGFAKPVAMLSRMLVILIWLISLAVAGLLWRRGLSGFSIQNPFVRVETGPRQR